MTLIMNPKPGESVYDPTCGSGGLLLNCALQLKNDGEEYRALKLFGQEVNLITSSIARMNMFMHGVEEFSIVRGDTISNPAFIENDELKKFNVILANPPYSIKSWNQKNFENDPYGRNIWGTPPKSCADYAFQQHIQKSLNIQNGRSITLWPHGILFRDAEEKMRRRMIEDDQIECIIGLGPNLFYNSPMESCLLITKINKVKKNKGKILIINAIKEVEQEKNTSFLSEKNINKIFSTYTNFKETEKFSKIVTIDEVLKNKGSLNIAQYVSNIESNVLHKSINKAFTDWKKQSEKLKLSMSKLFKNLE